MARQSSFPERIQGKLAPGTLLALDAQLEPGETRGEQLRRVVMEWLATRNPKCQGDVHVRSGVAAGRDV